MSLTLLSLAYIGFLLLTIVVGTFLWHYFDALTYRIVTLFISVIILSNCVAKLYTIFIFNDVP